MYMVHAQFYCFFHQPIHLAWLNHSANKNQVLRKFIVFRMFGNDKSFGFSGRYGIQLNFERQA